MKKLILLFILLMAAAFEVAAQVEKPYTRFSGDTIILSAGNFDIKVSSTRKYDLASYKLTVTYPNGIAACKSGRSYAKPTIDNTYLYSRTEPSVTQLSMATSFNTSTNVATYSVTNTANDTYIPEATYSKMFTLLITIDNDMDITTPREVTAKVNIYNIVCYDAENDPDFQSPISDDNDSFYFKFLVPLTISDAGYATFYSSDTSYVLAKGAEAFVVDDYDDTGDELNLHLVSCGRTIPKSTPVIVKAEAGEYTIMSVPDAEAPAPSVNLLKSTTAIDSGKDVYTLSTNGDNVGFYKYVGELGDIDSWKAVFQIPD